MGGSVLRFIDSTRELSQLWLVDFDLAPETGEGAGLNSVDPLAQRMNDQEMRS